MAGTRRNTENWKQRMARKSREDAAKEAANPKSPEIAKVYDTHAAFKSRDDRQDHTPLYKHR